MRTEPRPCATCASEPGAADDPVLGGEAHRLLVEGRDRDARVEDLDRVDVVDDRRAGARSRAPSAGGRTGAARRRARPGAGSRRSSPRSVIPRGIFSSMKRPITSPWSAVLTSSPTITLMPYSAALARASSAPEISLWSVTAIAPEAALARGGEQHLDRRRAVVRVVGVHVQVDVDQLALGAAARAPRAARSGSWRRAASSRVDRLDARRRRAPTTSSRRAARRARAAARAAPASRDQPLELGGEHVDVAGLEQQPELAVAAAPPRRPAGARRPARRPAPSARTSSAGRGRAARARRRRRTSACASTSSSVASVGDARRTRSRSARCAARRRRGAGRASRRSPPSRASVGSRRSARRNSRSAARSSSVDERDPQRAARRPRAAHRRVAPGRSSR